MIGLRHKGKKARHHRAGKLWVAAMTIGMVLAAVFLPAGGSALATTAPPCSTSAPLISVQAGTPYYANYQDELAGVQSVDYAISVSGQDAIGVSLLASMPTNGARLVSSMPVDVGNLYQGQSSTTVTLRYYAPPGGGQFSSTLYYTAGDYCEAEYYYPSQLPASEKWIRPPQTFLDSDGLHVYAGTTNLLANAALKDDNADGTADGWSSWINGVYNASPSVIAPSGSSPGEQVFKVYSTTGWQDNGSTFGIWQKLTNSAIINQAMGAEVRIDWLPSTTQAQKDAMTALTGIAAYFGGNVFDSGSTLTKNDIGKGWRRVYFNQKNVPQGDVYYQLNFSLPQTTSWNVGCNNDSCGGLEIHIRKPQLENTNYAWSDGSGEHHAAYTTPAAFDGAPGVTMSGSQASRETGFAQAGHNPQNQQSGYQTASRFSIDGSRDWGYFVQWKPQLDASEMLLNKTDWQIVNFNSHWDAATNPSAHNENHLDINVYQNAFHLVDLSWDANSNQQTLADSGADLTSKIRLGDTCRAVFWKTNNQDGTSTEKVEMYVFHPDGTSYATGTQYTGADFTDLGIMHALTLGNEHREVADEQGYFWEYFVSNASFQHISADNGTVTQTDVDNFLQTGARGINNQTAAWWDLSTGSDLIYVRNNG